jgi:hypothetical protein
MADKIILGYTTANEGYTQDKVMVLSGKDGGSSWDPSLINNPVNSGYAVDPSVEDTVLLDYVRRGQLRIIVLKIASTPPDQPSDTTYTALEPSNMDIEDWNNIIRENVKLAYPAGTYVGTNPHGLAQVGDWLYIVDYDSRKIVVVGADEFDTMTDAPNHTLQIPPYDMGLGTAADLPDNAKGKAIIALKEETTDPETSQTTSAFYLYALYIVFNGTTGEHFDSILVKLAVSPPTPPDPNNSSVTPDSGLSYAGQVTMGLNGQEVIPGFVVTTSNGATTSSIRLFVPNLGGRQLAGSSNGVASSIMSVPAFGDWENDLPDPVTHITGVNPVAGQELKYFDIHALGVSTREDGSAVFYFLTASFLAGYKGFDYRIYKSTTSNIGNAVNLPLDSASFLDIAEIVDEGRVYSTANPLAPYGIYYLNLLLQNADTADGERIIVFLGSEILISGASNYKARALIFGDGEGTGRIGGKNVNSAIAPSETIRQYAEDQSLKRGVRASRISIPSSGEEEEQEEE